jgi:hypothetical protein
VDDRIPPSFLRGPLRAPIAIRVESAGNKAAENVTLGMTTKVPIVDCEVEPAEAVPMLPDNQVRLKTSAKVADSTMGDNMICGYERAVYADKGYESIARNVWLAERGSATASCAS